MNDLRPSAESRLRRPAFTLVELLVVIAIIAVLVGILVPSLSAVRQQARGTVCSANLRSLGQGIYIYTGENSGQLLPSRLPKIDPCNAYGVVGGQNKYRPTFLAILGEAVGLPAFADPQACKTTQDRYGEDGDRQNYANRMFVCPEVAEWTDERNGSYGWNYQFLGNARLDTAGRYKNWSVRISEIRVPANTIAIGDAMGTAASWPTLERMDYEDNSRDPKRFGNEGFNLDPPHVDPVSGEMAEFDNVPQARTAVDPRHDGRGAVLWLDGRCDLQTLDGLGYDVAADGVVSFTGRNHMWSGRNQDVAWTTTP
jgi:prepilin-type N-terminal cleavage/methylation domain-containing protein/prepilin-type processing-associated H-X9-DG protein